MDAAIVPSTSDGSGQLTEEAMYRVIIGPKNTDYYLRYFARRDAGGKFMSWNWPCALLQFWWALYRKCYGFAFGGLVLTILFGFIAGAIFGGIAAAMGASANTIDIGSRLVGWIGGWFAAVFANGFYHRKARRLIRNTAHINDTTARIAELARRGGTTAVWLWIMLVFIIVGILAAIALPAYQDYTIRARVSEAVLATSQCRTSVAEIYRAGTQAVAPNAWGCGEESSTPATQYVQTLTTDANGVITLKLQDIVALGGAAGKTLTLTPVDADGAALTYSAPSSVTIAGFKCAALTISPKYLPGSCR